MEGVRTGDLLSRERDPGLDDLGRAPGGLRLDGSAYSTTTRVVLQTFSSACIAQIT